MRDVRALLPVGLIGAGVAAAAGFLLFSRRVARRQTRAFDARARKRFPKRRRPATRRAAELIQPLGKWYGQIPLSGLAALGAWRLGGLRAAAPISSVSAAAASLAWLLERTMKPRKPPPGRHSPSEPAFPSGHALQTSAAAIVAAYVLSREGASPVAVLPVATLLPIASGLAKLYMDKHWLTDVLGGYLVGAALGMSAAGAYELGRR